MGYRVDYAAMQSLLGAYSTIVGEWSQGFSSVMGAESIIEASTHIAGNSANRMKEYLNTVYSCLHASLSGLLNLFSQNFLLYTEAYYQQIDQSGDTYIDESEQSERRSNLKDKRAQLQQIGLAAEGAAQKVSDLVAISSLDISDPDAELGRILSSLDDLDNAIGSLESTHSSSDFAEIDALINQLEAYLKEVVGLSTDSKINFSVNSFLSLSSVPGLLLATHNAFDKLDSQKSDVASAAENLEKRLEQQRAEMEERERRAKWAKAAVGVLAVIATGIAIGTGVGTLIVPVICGVTKCAFNAAADEYVKYGMNTDQWDRAYIGKEAIKGWFIGFTSGIVPPGTGAAVKATISSSNSALWGGLDNVYDQMTTTGTVSDMKSVFFDAAKSGTSSFASSMVSNVVSDQLEDMSIGFGLDKYTNPSNDVRHYVGTFIEGSTESVTTGIAERLTSTTVETAFDAGRNIITGKDALDSIDLKEKYSKVMSFEEIGSDFVKGGIKETTTSYFKERTPDKETGLTPIIQAKLGYETDSESGITPAIQESLKNLEDKGIWEKSHLTDWHSTDWENTASSPSEILQMEEMDRNGEFLVDNEDYSFAKSTTDFSEAQYPTMRTPKESSGTWLGDRGNSGFIPNNPEAQEVMRAYGQDSVTITNRHPDFSPFSVHETPWGHQKCEVGIGHMTSERTGTDANYYQADEALAKQIGGGVTSSDIRHYRESNGLTWHEVEDGTTMQLIPTIINSSVSHTGGTSISGYGQKIGDISHEY